ncbi:MAG: hypothetical protein ACKO9H_11495 [Planctomycetota bacterium]
MKLGLALLITLFSVALVQEADAQWYPYGARPVRSLDRWLGIGYSSGYHTQNPGPDSDYYQPYSDLNTGLQSWLPADSGVQPTPAELPDDSPAPSYAPQSLRSPIGPGQTRSGLSGRRVNPIAPSGAFGWSSGASRDSQSAPGPVNSGFPGSGQRVGRVPSVGTRR